MPQVRHAENGSRRCHWATPVTVPNGTEIRVISGKNFDLDMDVDLDVDLDSREQAAGSQTVQLQLLAS